MAKTNKKKYKKRRIKMRRVFLSNDITPHRVKLREINKNRHRHVVAAQRVQENVMRIAGKQLKFTMQRNAEKGENFDLQKYIEIRKQLLSTEIIGMPSHSEIGQLVDKAHNQMSELADYMDRGDVHVNAKLGRSILTDTYEKAPVAQRNRRNDEIEQLILAPMDNILRIDQERFKIKINDKVSAYVNKSQERKISELTGTMHCDYLSKNDPEIYKFSTNYTNDSQELAGHEKKHAPCKCTNGHCGRGCHCVKIHNFIGKNKRLAYSCSSSCGCEGKCSKAFQEPDDGALEVIMHPIVEKGLAVRSTTYFGQGEAVMELRGRVHPRAEEEEREVNSYAFDTFQGEDREAILKLFENEARLGNNRSLLNKTWRDKLKKVMNVTLEVDPTEASNEGRYISSSCLANARPILLFENGLNPLNLRIMMVTTQPVYPGEEVTFFYSHRSICSELLNICRCGHLCCIRRRELFPFITKEHLHRFYTKYYEMLHKEFIRKVGQQAVV